MKTRVKICCISSIDEANTAIALGVNAIGLVGNMPSGPGVISDELIKTIAASVPEGIDTFMLTSETSAKKIVEHHNRTLTNTIQIVDELKEGTYSEIRSSLPSIKLVQVIHVIDDKSVDEAVRISEFVDALLLDSGNPSLKVKELGGTGRVNNWSLSRKIVEQCNAPVYLAGGLKAENVQKAIEEVQPYGVDLCSGVRTNGKLDKKKLIMFLNKIWGENNISKS
ncbi:MAG: phosphoribosylanthranilate isomerase [Candidatus Kapaibacterium sp.]